MKRYNTLLDVSFSIDHDEPIEQISKDEMLDALQARIDQLREEEDSIVLDAIGINDTIENETHIRLLK